MPARIQFITGATGFIGRRLTTLLLTTGDGLRLLVRDPTNLPAAVRQSPDVEIVTGDLTNMTIEPELLSGVDTVFHLAGRAHLLNDISEDPAAAYQALNVTASEHLAEAASDAGVRRFVYASSIKVNGEHTTNHPFHADDPPAPEDDYGRSKQDAEAALFRTAQQRNMTVCVVRPPLVYGPGVGANFARLLRLAGSGLPLPFASIHNRRTLVGLDNLCDLLITCGKHPAAGGQVFLAGDGESVSTPELIQRLGDAVKRPVRLLPYPPGLLALLFRMLGRRGEWERLSGSLEVDISKNHELLDWFPAKPMAEELAELIAELDND